MKDIISKFKFKNTAVVINPPAAMGANFLALGFHTRVDPKIKSTNTLVFVNNNKEYLNFLSKQLQHIEPDSILWLAYPKGTSKIKTDINRDSLRITGEQFGITTVTAISIDDTWSALRFRPIEKVGK